MFKAVIYLALELKLERSRTFNMYLYWTGVGVVLHHIIVGTLEKGEAVYDNDSTGNVSQE